MKQGSINAIYRGVSNVTGALCVIFAALWIAVSKIRSTSDLMVVIFAAALIWRAAYYFIAVFLFFIIGRPVGEVEDNPLTKPISLNAIWPRILDVATAKTQVKRASGFVFIYILALVLGGIISVSLKVTVGNSILVGGEILGVLVLGWGITNYFPWAGGLALLYCLAKTGIYFGVHSPAGYYLLPISALIILANAFRGIIFYRKYGSETEKPSSPLPLTLSKTTLSKSKRTWIILVSAGLLLLVIAPVLEFKIKGTILGKGADLWMSKPVAGEFLSASHQWTIDFGESKLPWREYKKAFYETGTSISNLPPLAGKFVCLNKIYIFVWEINPSQLNSELKNIYLSPNSSSAWKLFKQSFAKFFGGNPQFIPCPNALGGELLVVLPGNEPNTRIYGYFKGSNGLLMVGFSLQNKNFERTDDPLALADVKKLAESITFVGGP